MTPLLKRLQFRNHSKGVSQADWEHVAVELLKLGEAFMDFADDHVLPVSITSLIRPKITGVSETDIHAQRRAFDASAKLWKSFHIHGLLRSVNVRFASVMGAVSLRDGVPRAVIFETASQKFHDDAPEDVRVYIKVRPGVKDHFHFQVRPC